MPSAAVRAMLWMMLSCAAMAVLWVMIRLLAEAMHPFVIVVWRNMVGLAFLLPALALAPSILRTANLGSHVRRSTSGLIATFATFYAVANAPLVNVLAINYTAPLFATLGAALFLGERVRWVRGAALAAGFAGMLLVLRPGATEMTPGLWAAIVSALATAVSIVAIKALTGHDRPMTVAIWSFILMTPVSFLVALPVWSMPPPEAWPLLLGLGAAAAAGQVALARAFALADTSALMPFDFVRFGLIVTAGILLFGEEYDAFTLAGGGVILAASLAMALRERALALERRKARPAET